MQIEVSNGEIVDKYTILQIKADKIKDVDKLFNIKNEIEYFIEPMFNMNIDRIDVLDLKDVNLFLWEVEEQLRICEEKQRFDDYFILLARQVYKLNDQRSAIKKKINLYTNSSLIEEKSYKQ